MPSKKGQIDQPDKQAGDKRNLALHGAQGLEYSLEPLPGRANPLAFELFQKGVLYLPALGVKYPCSLVNVSLII